MKRDLLKVYFAAFILSILIFADLLNSLGIFESANIKNTSIYYLIITDICVIFISVIICIAYDKVFTGVVNECVNNKAKKLLSFFYYICSSIILLYAIIQIIFFSFKSSTIMANTTNNILKILYYLLSIFIYPYIADIAFKMMEKKQFKKKWNKRLSLALTIIIFIEALVCMQLPFVYLLNVLVLNLVTIIFCIKKYGHTMLITDRKRFILHFGIIFFFILIAGLMQRKINVLSYDTMFAYYNGSISTSNSIIINILSLFGSMPTVLFIMLYAVLLIILWRAQLRKNKYTQNNFIAFNSAYILLVLKTISGLLYMFGLVPIVAFIPFDTPNDMLYDLFLITVIIYGCIDAQKYEQIRRCNIVPAQRFIDLNNDVITDTLTGEEYISEIWMDEVKIKGLVCEASWHKYNTDSYVVFSPLKSYDVFILKRTDSGWCYTDDSEITTVIYKQYLHQRMENLL